MNRLYRNISLLLLVAAMAACSKDDLKEETFLDNSTPGAVPDGSIVNNPFWAWVKDYPGFVPVAEARVEQQVVVNGRHVAMVNAGVGVTPEAWQSSGLYVVPGEMIRITVPAGAASLNYRVGGFNTVLEKSLKRYADMNIQGTLTPGENQIMSYFGGHLYFYVTTASNDVTLQVNGAVKSPDFILGETDVAAWKEAVRTSLVPYGELCSKYITLTLPLKVLRQVEDPTALLNFYDEVLVNDYNKFFGLPDETPNVPWRLRKDIQLPEAVGNGQFLPGYPVVVIDNLDSIAVQLPKLQDKLDLSIFQALARTYIPATMNGEAFGNTFSRLNYHHLKHRKQSWPVDGNMETVISGYVNKVDPAKTYSDLTEEERVGMFVQLAQQYGWNIYAYISQQMINDEVIVYDQDKNDAIAMYAAEYADANLKPFFDDWGFPLSSYAVNYLNKYPAITVAFWKEFTQKFGGNGSLTPVVLEKGDKPSYSSEDRAGWTIKAKRMVNGKEEDNTHEEGTNGKITCLVDGDATTYWHSKWESENAKYPHTLEIDMKKTTQFNYFYYRQRNTDSHLNKCRRLQLFVKDNSNNWVGVDESKVFYLGRGINEQRIYLSKMYEASQIKLVLLSPHPKAGTDFSDAPNQPYSVSVVEFGVGRFE